MNKIAVIYKSKYGATKQYAQWIAEDLEADLFESHTVAPADLHKYNLVIYGGGLYASGIAGARLVIKNSIQNMIIFTVGLANPETTDYTEIIKKNIPPELLKKVKLFHLRGGMDYKKLGPIHRGMMAMMKKMTVGKKKEEELTEEDKTFLDTYGGNVQFTDRNTIAPLIEYAKNLI